MITPLPKVDTLMEVCEATWPPARRTLKGAWTIRDGAGGGKRASATTENFPTTEADVKQAEAEMQALNQPLLFQIRPGDEALDKMLEAHGYRVIDPVNIWAVAIDQITRETAPPVSGFAVWPPLNIMTELWEQGGIAAPRRAVMHRVEGPKTGLLGRTDDTPAGAGFVAIHNDIAMIHALHVDPKLRRMGTGRHMILTAAHWAKAQGANVLSLIVTQGNLAANPLYASLGMQLVGHYHYRIKGDIA